MKAKSVSIDRARDRLGQYEKRFGRAITWSICTDMKDLMKYFRREFQMDSEEAKKLVLKVVRYYLRIL